MIRDPASCRVIRTGPGTSVQDFGRIGMAHWGIPVSGVMDKRSAEWANHLLQNPSHAAVLEISQPGFHITFSQPTAICLAGAVAKIQKNGKDTNPSGLISIEAGDEIEVGSFQMGARLYLAIKDGFQTETILHSKSWYEGITERAFIKRDQEIPYFTSHQVPSFAVVKVKWNTEWYGIEELTAYAGPDWQYLSSELKEKILSQSFTVSTMANRMAVQMVEQIPNTFPDLPTNPVYPGTVQLTSGGKLLLLMRDAQVTGGYPRIMQLDEPSQCILAQKRPGQALSFKLTKL
jgi:biotin-dependent carboxylase-like uncharacterized protein